MKTEVKAIDSLSLDSLLKSNVNEVVGDSQLVTDAADQNVIFLKRQLTEYEENQDYIFPEMKTPSIISVSTQGGWKTIFTHALKTPYAEKPVIMECCEKLPVVGYSQCEVESRAVTYAIAATWDWCDVQYAREAGEDIEGNKAMIAGQALYERLEEGIWHGESRRGVMGIMNNPTVNRVYMPQPLDATDPILVVEYLTHMIMKVISLTSGAGKPPNTLLVPPSVYSFLSSTRLRSIDGGLGITLMDAVLQSASPFLTRIDWVNELETAGIGGKPACFAFYNDPSHLRIRIPIDLTRANFGTTGNVYFDGKQYSTFWYIRYGGVRMDDICSPFILEGLFSSNCGFNTFNQNNSFFPDL